MSDLCLHSVDSLFFENTCKLEGVLELNACPDENNPFNFFDLNLSSEAEFALDNIKHSKNYHRVASCCVISYGEECDTENLCKHPTEIIPKLTAMFKNSKDVYAKKVAYTIGQIVDTMFTKAQSQCDELIEFEFAALLFKRPFLNKRNKEVTIEHNILWHQDGFLSDDKPYQTSPTFPQTRASIVFHGLPTPFSNNQEFNNANDTIDYLNENYSKVKRTYDWRTGTSHSSLQSNQYVQYAPYGFGAVFDRQHAIHGQPEPQIAGNVQPGRFKIFVDWVCKRDCLEFYQDEDICKKFG